MQVVSPTLSPVVSADLIREARLRAGFTQAELADPQRPRTLRDRPLGTRRLGAKPRDAGRPPAVCGYDLIMFGRP